MIRKVSLTEEENFTLGATNWETLFTAHLGKDPVDTQGGRRDRLRVR